MFCLQCSQARRGLGTGGKKCVLQRCNSRETRAESIYHTKDWREKRKQNVNCERAGCQINKFPSLIFHFSIFFSFLYFLLLPSSLSSSLPTCVFGDHSGASDAVLKLFPHCSKLSQVRQYFSLHWLHKFAAVPNTHELAKTRDNLLGSTKKYEAENFFYDEETWYITLFHKGYVTGWFASGVWPPL